MDDAGVTLSSDSGFVIRRPAPQLRPYVDQYAGYRLDGVPDAVHRGLPSRHLTMIVSIGEPIHVLAQPDGAQASPGDFEFVLGGLQASPALIAADGPQEGLTIELTPLGARALLGVPARALWSTAVEADAVIGREARRLRDRLHDLPRWCERFAACDAALTRLLHRQGGGTDASLGMAWRRLVASGGSVGVEPLAEQVGWSRRYLARRFADEFGLSPKAAARVVRFERACALLRAGRGSLADVAHACGYYDQPHLNRDFRALAGCSPTAWIRSEFPFLQDGDGVGLARSGA
jgi:AraC-like DNA-binding protein